VKLNKQGVRDLNSLRPKEPEPDFGKNQMPPEMASKLLSEQPAEFGAPLDPQVVEFLHLLAEECAETVQRVTKILRFGLRKNPWNGKDNVEQLEAEVGDILAVLDVLAVLEVIQDDRVNVNCKRKLDAFIQEENPARPRIRHMSPELLKKLKYYKWLKYEHHPK
jgi:NTP pyrophosphatase (non-canonical NTP hydrolase)